MKKIVAVVLMFALAITCGVTTSAAASTVAEITVDDKIGYLIAQGFPEEFLENKEDPDINEMYEMFYGDTIQFLGMETVGLTEKIGSSDISVLGIIPEDHMQLKISKVQRTTYDSTTNKYIVSELVVYVDYEWFDGRPFINKNDGISVNWDSGLFTFKKDSFHSTDYKAWGTVDSGWVEFGSANNPAELNQGGLGYFAELTNQELGIFAIAGQKGTAHFTLLPKSRIYSGSSRVSSINAEYVHNKSLFNTVGFSYSGFSITVNLSGSKDSVAKALNYYYAV